MIPSVAGLFHKLHGYVKAPVRPEPVRRLYHIRCTYRTPSGKESTVHKHCRGDNEGDAIRSAKIEICAQPSRKVARGVDGIECKIYGESA